MRNQDPSVSPTRRAGFRLGIAAALLLSLCLPSGSGIAGKNDGGAMIVHTSDAIVWSFTDQDYCDDYEGLAPADCESAVTRSDVDGAVDAAIVWFLAAFHDDAGPGVTVVYFGADHNLAAPSIPAWGACGPEDSVEIPDDGWPHDPQGAGCSVGFGEPVIGQRIFPFYWLAAYGGAGKQLGTAVNPSGGYAGFVSDDEPGFLDEIVRFGTVRWFEPGENACPVPPAVGACCLPDATCIVLLEPDCEGPEYHGIYQGDDTTCEILCGPCCYWDQDFDTIVRRCAVTGYDDCTDEEGFNAIQIEVLQGDPPELILVGADWGPPGWNCSSDPQNGRYCQDPRDHGGSVNLRACCIENRCYLMQPWICELGSGIDLPNQTCEGVTCPPEAIETTTWGKIRQGYR